jgi:hypothetical protein
MVDSPIEATSPRRITSCLISLMLKRESGSPGSLGSSQARAFTATTIPGGKDTGPALPRPFLQAGDPLLEEAPPPLAHDLAGYVQALGDLVVTQALGGVQYDLGSDHVTIR